MYRCFKVWSVLIQSHICSVGNGLIQTHKSGVVLGLFCSCMWLCLRLLCLSILGTSQSTFLIVKSLIDTLNERVKAQGFSNVWFLKLLSTHLCCLLLHLKINHQSCLSDTEEICGHGVSSVFPTKPACRFLPFCLSAPPLCWNDCFASNWFSSLWGGQLQRCRRWKAHEDQ